MKYAPEQPENLDSQIVKWAQQMSYPATPDAGGRLRRRLQRQGRTSTVREPRIALRRSLAVLGILLAVTASLLAVPPVRATLAELIQLGAVRVRVNPYLEVSPSTSATVPSPSPSLVTPKAAAAPSAELAGETSLAVARRAFAYQLKLPDPATWGEPQHVYLQDLGASVAILLWADAQTGEGKMSLTVFDQGAMVEKTLSEHKQLAATTVNGAPALWMSGAHILQLRNGNYEKVVLVDGNVLVWAETGSERHLTYRLESNMTMQEAVEVAESLR